MAGPDCDAVCAPFLGESFKLLRATPTATNAWPSANGLLPFCGGISGSTLGVSLVGLTGTALAPASQVISWPQGVTAVVDSTIIVVYSAVSNRINYGLTQPYVQAAFGECPPEQSEEGTTVDGSCLFDPCLPLTGASSACSPCPADGLLQFIAQVCASPSLSYLGQGLNLTIAPPSFPASIPGSTVVNVCNPGSSFQGCGNFNPLNFSLGQCANGCQKTVSLIYIGCPAGSSDSFECTPALEGYGPYTVSYYNWIYANTLFSLSDKNGVVANFKKACYLKVEPVATEVTCFTVYFGQTRNCNGINILLICCLVDLACLYWNAKVYVITSARPLYTVPN